MEAPGNGLLHSSINVEWILVGGGVGGGGGTRFKTSTRDHEVREHIPLPMIIFFNLF